MHSSVISQTPSTLPITASVPVNSCHGPGFPIDRCSSAAATTFGTGTSPRRR